MRLTEKDEARFYAKVALPNEQGCMLWMASPDGKGYGQFRVAGKTLRAHRVAWLIATGEWLPPEVKLLHRCDRPLCVRMDDLRPGTQIENMIDMRLKGRARNGNSGKRVCKRGHVPNWYTRPNGMRNCRNCAQEVKLLRHAPAVA